MKLMNQVAFSVDLPVSIDKAFAWHEREGALDRMIPPWQNVKLIKREGSIRNGDETLLELKLGPLTHQWLAQHRDYHPPHQFTDVQIKGPFHSWKHQHIFTGDQNSSRLTDQIEFELPFGPLGEALGSHLTEKNLEKAFLYRHTTLKNDLIQHESMKWPRPLRFLISGGTGLVGSALTAFLRTGGHSVTILTRKKKVGAHEWRWDAKTSIDQPERLSEIDVVIHLAGESIAADRWSDAVKKEILDSRILSTRLLVDAIEKASPRPPVFICASAIGFYGDRGDSLLDESAQAGQGFLADVCRDWEAEARRAEALGCRTVQGRIGVVLSPNGGALQKMLTPFRLGLGGAMSSGQQYMSWISLDDLVYSLSYCATQSDLQGPVNLVSPNALTNKDFSKTLASALHRPLGPPIPKMVLKAMAGELAEALLLASTRVVPNKLERTEFKFTQPDLSSAFSHLLGL
jgi:uncharacterized protein (TIGR01777 family)